MYWPCSDDALDIEVVRAVAVVVDSGSGLEPGAAAAVVGIAEAVVAVVAAPVVVAAGNRTAAEETYSAAAELAAVAVGELQDQFQD